MASNSIQIYNDTVLKQSILQGYEVQRTNENLGKFTMGELAFTRDTGRVFVGNFTNTPTENDSESVSGGILTGNKYLGFIDSKPLIHSSSSGKTGAKPLSYEFDTYDSNTDKTQFALFGRKSRFRQTDGDNTGDNDNGKNGWNKKSDYIEKYGVYSGDYTYDLYNNAIILFDKNITVNQTEQPVRKLIDEGENKIREVYYDRDGKKLEPHEQRRRTPLYNNSNLNENEYPIYGDGYVIMRVLEPDGVTIGYKDRTFKYDTNNYNEDGSPTGNDGNWSHNYLEVKSVPAATLTASFDSEQFQTKNKRVCLKDQQNSISSIGLNHERVTLPQNITLSDKATGASDTLFFNFESTENITDPNYDKIFTLLPAVDANGNSGYKVSIRKQNIPNYTILLKDGLVNPITGQRVLHITPENSSSSQLALGFKSASVTGLGAGFGYNDPFFINSPSQLNYIGTLGFNNTGSLTISEQYDLIYAAKAEHEIEKFDNNDNVSLNYLRTPMPICWNTKKTPIIDQGDEAAAIAEETTTTPTRATTTMLWLTAPFFHCLKKSYNTTVGQSDFQDVLTVIGNNTYESSTITSNIPVIDGLSFSPIKEDFYESKIKNSTSSTRVLASLPIDFDIELPNQIIQNDVYSKNNDGYIITNYYGADTQIPNIIYYKQSDKKYYQYKSSDKKYVILSPQPSEDDVSMEISHSQITISSKPATLPSNFSIPKPYTIAGSYLNFFDKKNNIYTPKENIDVENLFILGEIYDSEQNKYFFTPYIYDTSNLIDLTSYLDQGEYIAKIEISTSSKKSRYQTLIDNKKITGTGKYSYGLNVSGDAVLLKTDTAIGATVYKAICNSALFTEDDTTNYSLPYMLKVTTSLGVTKYVPLNSILSYSSKQILPHDIKRLFYIDRKNAFKEVSDTDLTVIYNKETNEFNVDKLDELDALYVYPIMGVDTSSLFDTRDSIIYDGKYYQFSEETTITEIVNDKHVTYNATITYRCTGQSSLFDISQYNNYIVSKVVLSDGKTTTTYSWTNADGSVNETGKNKITTWVSSGEISIPQSVEVKYTMNVIDIYMMKTAAGHPNGYRYPTGDFLGNDNKFIIPAHASSVIMEVHRQTSADYPISIYFAGHYEQLSHNITSSYSFPYGDTSSSSIPTLKENSCINSNEKLLYNSMTSGCETLEVPLHKTSVNNNKGFAIRVANAPSGSSNDKFLIRVIGYRV